ncbi:endonuclease domain-containing protein [Microbacterium arborescens]|uniref:endonuclease domain-containing protein n=1 Tax=Microbacterium arborescens TaxID=33883 RepID=UPI003C746841
MDESQLASWMRRTDGVARTTALHDAGASRHRVQTAIETGALLRVRRGWVALPDADPELVAAARHGVVIACISAARRLGLWVLAEDRPHVAARPHAGRAPSRRATVHWHEPAVPRHPDSLVDRVENVLVTVARCQPFESALVIWESALRRQLTSREVLSRLDLPPAARKLLSRADPYSDSGLETILPQRLRWLGVPLRQQVWLLGRPVDLLVGERLVVQIDGGHHVGRQRAADIEHDAQLMLHGYHVIRVTYAQVVDEWPQVHGLIATAVAQGLHRAG